MPGQGQLELRLQLTQAEVKIDKQKQGIARAARKLRELSTQNSKRMATATRYDKQIAAKAKHQAYAAALAHLERAAQC